MSNYVKSTNFYAKDALSSGNPDKIIKGAEIDAEFNAIATAVATKTDANSPTFTGVPVAPTASAGTNTTQLATTAFVTNERTATATLENKTITSPIINQIIHEGTADDFETSLVFTDPTADRTLTFPDKTGTLALTSEIAAASNLTTASGTYAVAGSSTITVTITAHGRSVGDVVYLNFTSGTLNEGYFTIASVTTNSFTFDYGSTQTTSGNVTGYYSNLGTVAIASSDEVIAGTSTSRAATPAGVIAAIRASLVLGTAVASTSGTSIDFTGIPSWVKRITVMFNGVSLSGTATELIQIGSSSFTTSGYASAGTRLGSTSLVTSSSTSGFLINTAASNIALSGTMTLSNLSGNIWVQSHTAGDAGGQVYTGGGVLSLFGVLDRVRITTSNGTDTFDSGSVNIMYE